MGDLRRSTSRAWLDLIRLPNLFIAAADVLAGFFFAGGMAGEWFVLVRLMLASMCLYAGGVALNDVVDVEQDLRERPHRPIASGAVTHAAAIRSVCILLGCGVLISASVSAQALLVSLALGLSILGYNFFKQTAVAPALMGLCRALNLLLGMYGLETLLPLPAWRPMAAMFLYVAAVTFFGRKEAVGGSRLRLAAGLAGIVAAIAMVPGFRWYGYNARYPESSYLALAMLGAALIAGAAAVIFNTTLHIQKAVRVLVIMIIVLDACIAWVSAGPFAAAIVGTMLIPTFALARLFRVT